MDDRSARNAADGPRPPTRYELPAVRQLTATVFGFDQPPADWRPTAAEARAIQRGARVIVRDGRPVSHIHLQYNHLSIYGCRAKIVSIGGVCTHPDYQGQGLATELLGHVIAETTRAGAALMLISGARGLYRRAHAVPVGAVELAEVTGDAFANDLGVRVRRAAPEDWPAFSRLYQAESVRFVRTADFVTRALAWRHSLRALWTMELGGQAVAYLALGREWDLPPRAPVRGVTEYAGLRQALVAGLPEVLAQAQLERVVIPVPRHDPELALLLRTRNVPLRPGTIPYHTARLLDLGRLARSLRPYLESRLAREDIRRLSLSQSGDSCIIAFGDECLKVGLSQAARLALGGQDAPKLPGELGQATAAIFPIPLPLPGLNYT